MTEDNVGELDLSVEVVKGSAAKFTQAILGFAGTIIFARALGPASFGGFYLLMSLVRVLDWPTQGWASAGKKRYSEKSSVKNEIVGAQLLVNLALISIAVVTASVAGDFLVSYTGVQNAPILFVLMFAALIFFYPFQKLLTAKGYVSLQAWNDTLRSVTTFGFQLALVLVGWGAAGMSVGWALSTALAVPISFYYLKIWPALPSVSTLRSVWSFARYSMVTSIFSMAYGRYDVLLLGFVVGTAASGYYEAALKLSVPATFVSTIAGSGLMAKVSNRFSKGESFHRTVSRTLSYSSILAIPMFFGGLVLSKQLVVTAYGQEYRSAAALLVGLLFYQIVRTQSKILVRTLSGMDKPRLIMWVSATTLGLNVIVGYALLLEIGPVGVVVGTIIAELLRYVVTAYYVHQLAPDITILPSLLRYQAVASGLMAAVVYFVAQSTSINSFLVLGTIVGLGGIIYFAALVLLSENFRYICQRMLSNFAR